MPKAQKADTNVKFRELPIRLSQTPIINRIYYLVENDRSFVMGQFKNINKDLQDRVKDLISKMATVKDYKSPIIKYHLHGYAYGEICPKPHRFFFFQKCGNNLIFFSYVSKKKNSFNDLFYKNLNKEKERYEREFEKFIARNRKNI